MLLLYQRCRGAARVGWRGVVGHGSGLPCKERCRELRSLMPTVPAGRRWLLTQGWGWYHCGIGLSPTEGKHRATKPWCEAGQAVLEAALPCAPGPQAGRSCPQLPKPPAEPCAKLQPHGDSSTP